MRESILMKLIVHTDGGARGNPGPAAVGVVIESVLANEEKVTIKEFGRKIGETTNNVAEYTAVIDALSAIKNISDDDLVILFYLDSTLVVNQINGKFRVKENHLRELLLEVHSLEQEVGGFITYEYVPREQNSRADYFVNLALDTK